MPQPGRISIEVKSDSMKLEVEAFYTELDEGDTVRLDRLEMRTHALPELQSLVGHVYPNLFKFVKPIQAHLSKLLRDYTVSGFAPDRLQ